MGPTTVFNLIILTSISQIILADYYKSKLFLDPQETYEMMWNYSEETIKIKIRVRTTGYVGFGLSPNGGMAGADMVVGWVKDGKVYFYDMHGAPRYNSVPLLDSHQDWVLISGKEDDSFTELVFGRNLRTCDEEEDIIISTNTMRVIWSYSEEDPESLELLHLVKHKSTTRGTRSVAIIHSEIDGLQPELPENAFSVDVTMNNHRVHQSDTSYWCKTSPVPHFDETHQIIALEPLIQRGNEGVVHHFFLSFCEYHNAPKGFSGEEFTSYMSSLDATEEFNFSNYSKRCNKLVGIWAVGGETYYFPENVGYNIGGTNKTIFFQLEVHYDNPNNHADIIDSSGYRLWLTSKPREEEASMLIMFANHRGYYSIPPHTDNFLIRSYCPAEYITKALELAGVEEINVLAYSLHLHVAGIASRLRHFRNGEELNIWAFDETYDFNYQTFRMLSNITIKKGDSFMVECNNKNTGDKPVWGGEGTYEEMCIAIMMYYPALQAFTCGSEVPPLDQLKLIHPDIKSFDYTEGQVTSSTNHTGQSYKEIMTNAKWTKELKQKYQQRLLEGKFMTYMHGIKLRGQVDVPVVPLEAKREVLPCTKGVPQPKDIGLGSFVESGTNTIHYLVYSYFICFVIFILI